MYKRIEGVRQREKKRGIRNEQRKKNEDSFSAAALP